MTLAPIYIGAETYDLGPGVRRDERKNGACVRLDRSLRDTRMQIEDDR
jgi:hypothetical protein